MVELIAPNVVLLEIGTNDLADARPEVVGSEIESLVCHLLEVYKVSVVVFVMSLHVVNHTTRRLLLRNALRFFSSILTLFFLLSLMFFVGFTENFLT